MNESITRRDFTRQSIVALLSGVAITLTGCGSDSSPAQPTPPVTDKTGTIASNHGHTAVVTAAQLTAGGGVTLSIQGSSAHTHTVELTAAEIVQIRNNQTVTKATSSTASHTHSVTFN